MAVVAGARGAQAAAHDYRAQRVEGVAYTRLGPDAFGCAVQSDQDSPVELKVTDRAALPAARRIADSRRFPVTVRLVSRRYSASSMAKVVRGLRKAAEGREFVAIVGDRTTILPHTCHSAQIFFTEENTAWAITQQRRFGGDRVTLRLVGPGDRIPL